MDGPRIRRTSGSPGYASSGGIAPFSGFPCRQPSPHRNAWHQPARSIRQGAVKKFRGGWRVRTTPAISSDATSREKVPHSASSFRNRTSIVQIPDRPSGRTRFAGDRSKKRRPDAVSVTFPLTIPNRGSGENGCPREHESIVATPIAGGRQQIPPVPHDPHSRITWNEICEQPCGNRPPQRVDHGRSNRKVQYGIL